MADENTQDPAEQGNPERPDWLPEKFKNEEAFVKSYGELESRLGELAERAKYADALEENYQELAAQVNTLQQAQRQQEQQGAATPLIQAYQSAYENGDAAQMLAVQAQISRLAVQEGLQAALPQVQQQLGTLQQSQADEISAYAARTLEARFGEQFEEAKDTMARLIETQPWLIPEEAQTNPVVAVNALENVYKLATHGAPAAQPQVDAEAERARLLAAQTASGAGTRVLTPDEQKQEWDAIKAAGAQPYWARIGQ